jgi:TRAP-type transport system small permease protein
VGVGKAFDSALHVTAAALVAALLATVTAGIVSRAANQPLSFTDELSGFLMVWLACAGWMIATRRGAHIRIRFFQDLLPARPHRGVEVMLQMACLVLGAVVAWNSVHLVRTNSDVEATTLPLATAWIYVPLFPAGVLTCIEAARALVVIVRGKPTIDERVA